MGLTRPSSTVDLIEAALPYYLSIGMTYNQYWYGNVLMVYDYQKAEMLRRERRNQEMLLQGLYVYRALGSFRELLGRPAFSKAPIKIYPYDMEVYPLTQEEADRQKARQEAKQLEDTKRYFSKGGL